MFIKFIHTNGEKRQVKRNPKSYKEVRDILELLWGETVSRNNIAYIDSDKELITILSDNDWNVCLEEINLLQKDKPIKKLTIKVTDIDDDDSYTNILTQSIINVDLENAEVLSEITKPENNKELNDWKIVSNDNFVEEYLENKLEVEIESVKEQNKPVIKEVSDAQDTCPETINFKITNTGNNDIKIDGDNLENTREQVQAIVPAKGFEINKAEMIKNKGLNESMMSNQSHLTYGMREEIKMMISIAVNQIVNTETHETHDSDSEVIHYGITCDGCNVHPIKGTRFKSLVKRNFDLCEKCEKTIDISHPMIRFRKTCQKWNFNLNKEWKQYAKLFAQESEPSQRTHHGRRFGPNGGRYGHHGRRFGPNGGRYGHHGRRYGPHEGRYGPHGGRCGPYGGRYGPHRGRCRPFGGRRGPFGKGGPSCDGWFSGNGCPFN